MWRQRLEIHTRDKNKARCVGEDQIVQNSKYHTETWSVLATIFRDSEDKNMTELCLLVESLYGLSRRLSCSNPGKKSEPVLDRSPLTRNNGQLRSTNRTTHDSLEITLVARQHTLHLPGDRCHTKHVHEYFDTILKVTPKGGNFIGDRSNI